MKIENILFFQIKTISGEDGSLSALESPSDIPFEIKRFYYIYDTPTNIIRGNHAHSKTKQLFICLNGSCKITCNDGEKTKIFLLDSPNKALSIPEGIWSSEQYCVEKTQLLVLCNTNYIRGDYIEDYEEFKKIKNNNN